MSRLAVVPELDTELESLFELPPGEFTAARNDLARRLKRAGQAEAAARVQALRKPTIPVWTINQLARSHPDDVEALIAAGDELRAAQEEALGGAGGERLRAATAAEREAIRGLTQQAQKLLGEAGQRPAAAVLERIAATLRSAALDPRGRELLAAGMLVEELESTGFGAFEGMKLPTRRAPVRRAPKKKAGAADERRRKERLRKLRERAEKLAAEAGEAERGASRAEAEAARERRKAERAAAAAERARAELESVETSEPE